MRSRPIASLALLIVFISPSGYAKNVLDVMGLLRRRADTLDDMVHQRADDLTAAHVMARTPQEATAATQSAAANLTGSDPANIDQAQIDATVSAACGDALASISSTPNEAGFLGCYNIPFLNSNTRVFEADLRLYQLAEPSGAFAGVDATDVSVQLSYPNAAFSIIPQDPPKKKRDVGVKRRQDAGSMDELQNFLFVGQVSNTLTLTKLKE